MVTEWERHLLPCPGSISTPGNNVGNIVVTENICLKQCIELYRSIEGVVELFQLTSAIPHNCSLSIQIEDKHVYQTNHDTFNLNYYFMSEK